MASAKLLKEQFVSGHSGTSLFEVTALILTAPMLLIAHSRVTANARQYLEIFVVAIPLLIAHTVAPDRVGALLIPGLCLLSTLLLESARPLGLKPEKDRAVTVVRGVSLLCTVIAILAVDFSVFPRRFAKTEWYGTGLMDIGVGAFCFTAAIVPRKRPRGLERTARAVGPLLVLGLARLAAVKAAGYQEHLSEYGLHWNFFFTLVVVRLVSDLFAAASPVAKCGAGVAALLLYQAALVGTPLGAWVLDDAPRGASSSSLAWQNKEGLASAVGYASLALAAEGAAAMRPAASSRDYVWLAAGLWAALLLMQLGLGLEVSRRQANLPFCVWVGAEGATILAMAELGLYKASPLMRALSLHQLPVFLFANALTGVVNVSMDTLGASEGLGLFVLALYVAAVCGVALRL